VNLAELQADGRIGGGKMARAFISAGWGRSWVPRPVAAPFRSLNWSRSAREIAVEAIEVVVATQEEGLRGGLAHLLQEMFVPFRRSGKNTNWRQSTANKLAEAAYAERQLPGGYLDGTRVLLLADCLEEAGCTDPDLLGHLRGPGPHIRSCWALDLILGKE
jgi:hypothetical protein